MTDEGQAGKVFELTRQITQILKHKMGTRTAAITAFALCGIVLNAIGDAVWSDDNEKAFGLMCSAQMKRAINEVQILRPMIISALEKSQKEKGE